MEQINQLFSKLRNENNNTLSVTKCPFYRNKMHIYMSIYNTEPYVCV